MKRRKRIRKRRNWKGKRKGKKLGKRWGQVKGGGKKKKPQPPRTGMSMEILSLLTESECP